MHLRFPIFRRGRARAAPKFTPMLTSAASCQIAEGQISMKVFYLFCVVLSVTLCYLVVVQRAQAWLAKSGKPATENTKEEHKTKNQNDETGKENDETTLKEN